MVCQNEKITPALIHSKASAGLSHWNLQPRSRVIIKKALRLFCMLLLHRVHSQFRYDSVSVCISSMQEKTFNPH